LRSEARSLLTLVSILKKNQSEAGYQQEYGKPQLAAEEGPAENQHKDKPRKPNPARNPCHRYKSPVGSRS
jgi:hypothetical protein